MTARPLLAALACALALSPASWAGPGGTVAVTGKTAYGEMAVEGALVAARTGGSPGAPPAASVRSGYHGSFRLDLPPGRYDLCASHALPSGAGTLPLAGCLRDVEVAPGAERLDRLLIPLVPAP